jgi:hypothetical protein
MYDNIELLILMCLDYLSVCRENNRHSVCHWVNEIDKSPFMKVLML